ncbi:MAG: response regulator transcription factor [Clostridia bacterium]|nr:response regulator transcription factor [Clostridia bacterium]
MKLLIVEDEPDILSMLRDYFEAEGYGVLCAATGAQAIAGARHSPDLILLDVGLPDMDGLSVCRALRDHLPCPILFLTARVSEADKLQGFAPGGDDYVLKPFSLRELGARVQAHLRREERAHHRTQIRFDRELVIDYGRRVLYVRGQSVQLPKKEFDIVALLSTHPGQVFDRERIYEHVWGLDGAGDSATVSEHVRRIRMKLDAAGCAPVIETVWGVGYRWAKR